MNISQPALILSLCQTCALSFSPAIHQFLFMWVSAFACHNLCVCKSACECTFVFYPRQDFYRSSRVFWGQPPQLNSLSAPPLLHAPSLALPTALLASLVFLLLISAYSFPSRATLVLNVWIKQRAELRVKWKEEMEWKKKEWKRERWVGEGRERVECHLDFRYLPEACASKKTHIQ